LFIFQTTIALRIDKETFSYRGLNSNSLIFPNSCRGGRKSKVAEC